MFAIVPEESWKRWISFIGLLDIWNRNVIDGWGQRFEELVRTAHIGRNHVMAACCQQCMYAISRSCQC